MTIESQQTALPLVLVALGDDPVMAFEAATAWRGPRPRRLLVLCDQPSPSAAPFTETGVEWLHCTATRTDADYWPTVVSALPLALGRVIVLRFGTHLPPHGLDRLDALASLNAAFCFPLSCRDALTRAFLEDTPNLALSVDDLDRWCNRHAPGRVLSLPQFGGFTAVVDLRRLPNQPIADVIHSDSALARALINSGAALLATDAVFLDDTAFAPTDHRVALTATEHEALLTRHPYTGLRHPLSELNSRGEAPSSAVPASKPVVLHLSHSWGGGLARWIADFAAGDDACEHWVLRSIGDWGAAAKSLALYRLAQDGVPVQTWTLTTPILATAVHHHEYAELLEEIIEGLPVAQVIVSTVIGHSLDVYRLPLPVVHVFHDYYPWCPPLYATWEMPCSQCDRNRLQACLSENPGHRFFRDASPAQLLALREAFVKTLLERSVSLVAPSASVIERWRALAPDLAAREMTVIEHGLDPDWLAAMAAKPVEPAAAERLQIVVLGSLAPHKGGALLEAALDALLAFADVHLIGCGDEDMSVQPRAGVTMIERYAPADLPQLLATAAPDVALLLSVVPETFSYTLSELQAAHIPCVATRLGAFAGRIEHGVSGFLIEPTAAALVNKLSELHEHREVLAAVRSTLQAAPPRTLAEMVSAYRCLWPEPPRMARRPRWPTATLTHAAPAMFIGPELRYRQALAGFLQYSRDKLTQSPRMSSAWRRRLARSVSAAIQRVESWLNR